MKGRVHTCDDGSGGRLSLALTALAAIVAASITHFAIDVIGDFVLVRDSYDDLAHGSRQFGAIAAGVCLLITLGFALRSAVSEARGNEGALLASLRRATPRSPWRHWASVTIASVLLVAAMEACDAALAGRPCDDVVELFGGSLLLAALVATSVAAIVCGSVRSALRRLTRLHRVIARIARIVGRFVRGILALRSDSAFDAGAARRTYAPSAVLGRFTGDRAPPFFPSLVFS